MKHTHDQKQHRYNHQLQSWGELLSQSCPSSAKQGGLMPAASICREPTGEETGLIAGLAWIWPEYSPVPGDPQLALLGVCWPEEYRITFFS